MLSNYTHQNTTSVPTSFTVTIPARKTGIKTLTYSYTSASGSTEPATAGTSSKTITVKAGTQVKRTGYTLSNTTYYQFWSGNASS